MRSMPFDSKITGYDANGIPQYDRASSAAEFARLLSAFLTNGIWGAGMFAVTAQTGMQVSVDAGHCMINGRFGYCDVPETLTLAADAQYPRIDAVVLRLDTSEPSRCISLAVHAGTAAQSPAAPALTRTSTVWELGLANILIPAQSTAVAQSRITDTRLNASRCGLVAAVNSQIDTTALYSQIQADLSAFKSVEQAGFSAWFAAVQGQLSQDAAGALQLQLDGKQDKLTAANAASVRQTLGAAQKTAATASLTAAGWSGSGPYTQTASVSGVTAAGTVVVSPAPDSFLKWGECRVRATAQAAGALTFTAESKPAAALTAHVLCLN